MLRDVGQKLWAIFNSLGISDDLDVDERDLETVLTSADVSQEELGAFLEVFGLSKSEAEAFMGQVVSLFNDTESTLKQKLKLILNMLGVPHGMQAVILSKLHHLNPSGSDPLGDLQQLEAFLANTGLPSFAFLGQVRKLFQSSNFSTADMLAVVQHVQGLVSDLQDFRGEIEAAVKDLFGLEDVSEASVTDAFDKVVGFVDSLGISKADVKLGIDAAMGFFQTLSITDVPALLADMHGLLVVAGIPNLQDAVSGFLDQARALKTLILSS